MNTVKTCLKPSLAFLLIACAKSVAPSAGGSESHFLDACVTSSECGAELSCHANVCTRECESAAQCEGLGEPATCVPATGLCGPTESDAAIETDAAIEIDAAIDVEPVLLSTSEVLGEAAQMAFIAGRPGAERLMLMGESGAVQPISEWPAPGDWSSGVCMTAPTAPRFFNMTFDSTGDYLAFVERESCDGSSAERVVVHDLVTGQSWLLGTFVGAMVFLGPGSELFATLWNGPQLYELDPAALTLTHRVWPNEETFGSGIPATFDGADVIIVGGTVVRAVDDGFQAFEPFRELDESWTLGEVHASASGRHLCTTASNMFDPLQAMALLASPTQLSMQPIDFGFQPCVFSADGRYVVYGELPFEIVDDELVPLPALDRTRFEGAYGDFLIGTFGLGEVIRYDPEAGTTEVLVGEGALDDLCAPEARFNPYTQLYLSEDRSVAVVQHTCIDSKPEVSGSIALDLATGDWLVIEAAIASEYPFYTVAWPSVDTAWLFPAVLAESARFYEISPGPEVTLRDFPELDGILHSPALPR